MRKETEKKFQLKMIRKNKNYNKKNEDKIWYKNKILKDEIEKQNQ
jgi:hypothetical protein